MWMIVFFLCWVVRIEAECVLQDTTTMKVTKYSGESVLLPCSCFNLQAQGTRWFKDNVRIDPTKPADRIHMTNQDFPGNLSLLISDLTKKDEGIYKCEGYQNSYRDFTLTVTGCTLMEQLTTLQIKRSSGESALLPCLCSSLRAKPESVRWTTTSRSGSMDTEISNTTGPYRGRVQMFNRHSPGNISLLISDLSEKDQGIYICVVDKHYTKHVHLLVKVPSVKNLDCAPLQSASLQILRRPGECVLLPCSCTDLKATPKSLTWMTTSESQSPDGGWKIISTTDVSYRGRLETFNHTSSGNLSLGLSDLTQEDHGSYRCLINGQKGGQITLLVLDAKSRGGTTSPLCIASFISVLLLVLLLGGLVFIFWRYKGQRKTQMGNDRQRRGTDQEREMSVTSTYEDLQHRYSAGQMYSTIGQNTGVQDITMLVCLSCGLLSSAQLQHGKNRLATGDTKSLSPRARDETIENEIEIELSGGHGNVAILMKLSALDWRLRTSERRLEELQRENKAQAFALREMERRLTYRLIKAETGVKEMGRNLSEKPKIAFSASVGGVGNSGPYNTDTTLLFKDVITNIGNAYRPATGIFTAPVDGVYLFSLFECSLSPQPASLSLHKNEEMIVSVAKRRSQHEGAENGSNAVTLQLEQGDQVYVRLWKDSWVYDSTAHFTTFSGTLLFSL